MDMNHGMKTSQYPNKFIKFENKAQRRMMGISWQDRICNSRIGEIVKMPRIDKTMMKGGWRWMRHVLRAGRNSIISQAIEWKSVVTRRRERPKSTHVRTMRKEAGSGWNSIRHESQDRVALRRFCEALYVTRHGSEVEI